MDPFRDDRTALRIRVDELEQKLVETREELVRVAEPHTTLAQALKKNEAREQAQADEIEKLETALADIRAAIVQRRKELARIKERLQPKEK
jgi:chromosome segregation ATPase